jgi:peptidoglycan hydrolase FlgJ
MADLFSPMQLNPALLSKPTAPKLPSGASQASIAKSAHDFEAMAIAQFLQPMFNTVDLSKGPFGGGEGEAAWRPMMVEQLAKQLANHGGLGLAKQIQAAMERAQENKRK